MTVENSSDHETRQHDVKLLKALLSKPDDSLRFPKSENEIDDMDENFTPIYVDCPQFIPLKGCILMGHGFQEFIKANKAIENIISLNGQISQTELSTLLKKEFKRCTVPTLVLTEINSVLSQSVQELLVKVSSSSKPYEFVYLLTLQNCENKFACYVEDTTSFSNVILEAWLHYLLTLLTKEFPCQNFLCPIISIQLMPKFIDAITGSFSRLLKGGDPRQFLIKYSRTVGIAEWITKDVTDKINFTVIERSYDYQEYSLKFKILNETARLSDVQIIELARLGALIEKIFGLNLRIIWQIKDGEVYIIHLEDVNEFDLSDFELKYEFNVVNMAADNDIAQQKQKYTPMSYSSLIVPMSQSQQLTFYNYDTNGLYAIGKHIQQLKINLPTAPTIQRLLSIDGSIAWFHISSNYLNYKYPKSLAFNFIEQTSENLDISYLNEAADSSKIVHTLDTTIKNSKNFWNVYYNLIALQRSWLYVIFKYICGSSHGMIHLF